MKFDLNDSQKKALDLNRDIIVSAGAGSGKTTVLAERYMKIFMKPDVRPPIAVENIVAITFTEKAAAQLRDKIGDRMEEFLVEAGTNEYARRISNGLENLGLAYISTIHGFCRRILSEFALTSRLDPSFSVMDEADADTLLEESLTEILYTIGRDPASENSGNLRTCLKYMGSGDLRNVIKKAIISRDTAAPLIDEMVSKPDSDEIPGSFDFVHRECLVSLSHLYKTVDAEFKRRKSAAGVLDFTDLLLETQQLLEKNETAREILKKRFRYFLLDEFQDTDPVQWRIFELLSEDHPPGSLFVVGDPKQSIYGFRRADVRLFYHMDNHIFSKNREQGCDQTDFEEPGLSDTSDERLGRISMNTNYRSVPEIIDFVNYLFSRIIKGKKTDTDSYDVEYENLIAHDNEESGNIEIFCPLSEDDREQAYICEAEWIAQKVLTITRPFNSENLVSLGEIAILLRRRTTLPYYEDALRKYNIPFITVGGLGFYQRREIMDLANLVKFFVEPENDPAMLGLLRSPFLRVGDDILFKISKEEGDSLFQRFLNATESDGNYAPHILERIRWIKSLLEKYRYKSRRSSLAEVLKEYLLETGGWASLASDSQSIRLIENVNKLMEEARRFDDRPFRSLSDFSQDLMTKISEFTMEGEAVIPEPDVKAVQIMTIHQSKGLERDVVFLPDLSSKFNLNVKDRILFDEKEGIGLKIMNPDNSYEYEESQQFGKIKEMQNEKGREEEKRLFYVGATRARKMLFLSWINKKKYKDQRAAWILDVFPSLPEHFNSEEPLTFEINGRRRKITVTHSLPEITPGPDSLTDTSSRAKKDSDLKYVFPVTGYGSHRVHSVTALNEFGTCPIYYCFHRILKWGEKSLREAGLSPFGDGDSEKGFSSIRGTIIHKLIEEYPFSEDPQTVIRRLIQMERALSSKESEILFKDIVQTWEKIATQDFMTKIVDLEDVRKEFDFELLIDANTLKGRADLVWKEKGISRLVDFKTGKVEKSTVQKKASRYHLQMDSYALFLYSLAPEQEKWPVSLYFVESNVFHDKIYKISDLEKIKEKFKNIIEREKILRSQIENSETGYNILSYLREEYCTRCALHFEKECALLQKLETFMDDRGAGRISH